MRVLLINPPPWKNTIRRLGPIIGNLFYNSPPLGLCYLASTLEQEKHKVKIIDAAVEGLSVERIIKRMINFSPDIVGISTFTVSIYSCYELAKKIKSKIPEIKIVVGGPHITSNPNDLLKHPEIDIAVIGEGEITFKELIEAMKKEKDLDNVKGLAYNVGGKVVFTPSREFISNLDILPFPARHLVPIGLYKPQPNDQRRLPKLSMISSRGCPYHCIFCDKNVFKNIYRSFSPRYIVNEMSHLIKEFKVKDIAFVDSTFTPTKSRVYKIVREIKNANLNVTWTCSVRANVLDKQLLKEMKNTGCWRVRLGIESGNDEVLKFINKGITKYQVRKVTNWAYELDLEPKGFFIIGHLIDTKQTIEETINFACSLPLKDVTVQVNTPMPHTPQYRIYKNYGSLITRDYSEFSYWEPVFIPKDLTRDSLLKAYRRFYKSFYLRPIIFWRHLRCIYYWYNIIKYVRGLNLVFYLFFGKLKCKLERTK